MKVCIRAMNVHRVFIGKGTYVNILYYIVYNKMGLLDKDMEVENTFIYGFGGEAVIVKGIIRLPLTIGEEPFSTTQIIEFMMVDQESSHNALLGRPLLKDMRVIIYIHHLSMKFPTPNGIDCIRGCQEDSRECYNKSVQEFHKKNPNQNKGINMLRSLEKLEEKDMEVEDVKSDGNILAVEEIILKDPLKEDVQTERKVEGLIQKLENEKMKWESNLSLCMPFGLQNAGAMNKKWGFLNKGTVLAPYLLIYS